MVDAQYRLLSEGLGIHHGRLIIGNSMGGMNVWLWGERYPSYMDALVPMASQSNGDGEPQLDVAANDAGDHPQ
jgi:homoserine O-acetyltransferase/O-succinyltransferase